MAHVYILQSIITPERFYTGSTSDLERRLQEHNSLKNTYSKRHAPWKIVFSEEYNTLPEARKREKYLKSAAGRRFIKKHIPR
jgi:predicted GIY-YIG superfamily endonuclease